MIKEGAVKLSYVKAKGFALFVTNPPESVMYILYEPTQLLEDVISYVKHAESPPRSSKVSKIVVPNVYACLSINVHRSTNMGASEVKVSAARKGYGPLMYDIAMAFHSGLVSDRSSVSSTARGVWQHYKDKRKDVRSARLHPSSDEVDKNVHLDDDDEDVRPTLKRAGGSFDTTDSEHDDDVLNRAYFSTSPPPNVSPLLLRNAVTKTMFDEAMKGMGASYDFDSIVSDAATMFSVMMQQMHVR